MEKAEFVRWEWDNTDPCPCSFCKEELNGLWYGLLRFKGMKKLTCVNACDKCKRKLEVA